MASNSISPDDDLIMSPEWRPSGMAGHYRVVNIDSMFNNVSTCLHIACT